MLAINVALDHAIGPYFFKWRMSLRWVSLKTHQGATRFRVHETDDMTWQCLQMEKSHVPLRTIIAAHMCIMCSF